MINVYTRLDAGVPQISIETLIAQHGPWEVLKATLTAMVRERKRRRLARRLPNYLRKDIGLPVIEDDFLLPPGAIHPLAYTGLVHPIHFRDSRY